MQHLYIYVNISLIALLRPGQPPRSPGGNFPVPSISPTPLLRFECWPGPRPYVSSLDASGSVLLSANAVNTTPGIAYDTAKDGTVFQVKAQIDGHTVASGIPLSVGAPTSERTFDWAKLSLTPRAEAYNLSCTATAVKSGKVFHNDAKVFYMPPLPSTIGGVIQTDGRTGGILVPGKASKTPLLPFGFYTAFGGYLDTNLTVLDEIKKEG